MERITFYRTIPLVITTLTPVEEEVLLLDRIVAQPEGAWSTRKISEAYAGNCLRVRRSGDDGEQDIGFSGNSLDTATLLNYVTAGGGTQNGFVVTWYDQSGNTRNVTNATAASQPQIVSGGSLVDQINGKPSIRFDGSDDALLNSGSTDDFVNADAVTAFAGIEVDDAGGGGLFNHPIVGDTDQFFCLGAKNAPAAGIQVFDGGVQDASATITLDTPFVLLGVLDGTDMFGYVDGGTPGTDTTTGIPNLTADLTIGGSGSRFFDGYLTEVLLYDSALSSADLDELGDGMADYAGTTWTSI